MMTARGRSRPVRTSSRRPVGSTSPASKRVTRNQNVNIDPHLAGDAAAPQGNLPFDSSEEIYFLTRTHSPALGTPDLAGLVI